MAATVENVEITACDSSAMTVTAEITFPANTEPGSEQVKCEIGVVNNGIFEKILDETFSLEESGATWANNSIHSPCMEANGQAVVARVWVDYTISETSGSTESSEFDCDCDDSEPPTP
ncbi:MAG: hypothetical protein VB858_00715 [Planctomycetaceae bacterium]